jgi:iron complex outermembrane recepter protein
MGTPETTANGFVEYSFPLGSLTGRLSGAINYSDRADLDPDSTFIPAHNLDDYLTTTSARFTIESGHRWSASLFGDNLTDENGNANSNPFDIYVGRIPPRTIGLQVEYHWD